MRRHVKLRHTKLGYVPFGNYAEHLARWTSVVREPRRGETQRGERPQSGPPLGDLTGADFGGADLRQASLYKVAMDISGHKMRAIFDRYNIVDEGDMANSAEKLEEYARRRKLDRAAKLQRVK